MGCKTLDVTFSVHLKIEYTQKKKQFNYVYFQDLCFSYRLRHQPKCYRHKTSRLMHGEKKMDFEPGSFPFNLMQVSNLSWY
jgi:hypothetical protein